MRSQIWQHGRQARHRPRRRAQQRQRARCGGVPCALEEDAVRGLCEAKAFARGLSEEGVSLLGEVGPCAREALPGEAAGQPVELGARAAVMQQLLRVGFQGLGSPDTRDARSGC